MDTTARVLVIAAAGLLTTGAGVAAHASGGSETRAGAQNTAAAGSAATSTGASPYVQASSPAQAVRVLDALRSLERASASARAAAAGVVYGPCELFPTPIYMRTSGGLGTKPYTDCKGVAVSSIRHQTDLRYQWGAWWHLAASYTGGNNGVARYQQRNVQWICKGRGSTTWAGTTLGTLVYLGKTYYARVYNSPTTHPCGA
ncbi:hypothetical protein [Actinomadura terrae]|uniref:hypothetical protein n=1 Tax=Actinomadura terrae TaxID=604353 RepID=UPI001FA7B8D2|nr:hypothetical protein [Actinomadura terrae]